MTEQPTSPGFNHVELIYKQESFDIIGAAIEVHRRLGPGFSEPIYQEALELELLHCDIPNEPQKKISVYYRENLLKKFYIPDFLCFERIIVEIKALNKLTSNDTAQMLNYLRISRMKLGILINFGSSGKLEWKRIVH